MIIASFLGFYFYKSSINVVDYKKYKYYDEDYINEYSGKILKSYDEYKKFIANQGLLLNEKDFEKSIMPFYLFLIHAVINILELMWIREIQSIMNQ